MGTAHRQYPDEFKREAVGLVASSGRPLSQIAQELGLPLRGCGLGATRPAAFSHAGADLAAGNARLRRENERLRMEREILKKTLRIFSEPPK